MSFLAPLFLLGAVAVAAPVLFHLIRRTTRERTPFSSVMFLRPTPPRLTRRHRLEHLLLLLLRCTVLVLLALGFARPFLNTPAATDPSGAQSVRRVILVDVSASMRRDGLWAEARAAVEAQVRRMGPGDRAALLVFDRQTTTLLSFDEWAQTPVGERTAVALTRFATVSPGWGATQLGNALISAAETLAETDSNVARARRQIVLVSDVQEGSRLDGLQGFDWPKDLELVVVPVVARKGTNAGLHLVGEPTEAGQATRVVRVRVSNASGSSREQFQVGWVAGEAAAPLLGPIDAYVPPGQSRVFSVPLASAPASAKAGDASRAWDRIVLRGDDETFDDTVYALPPAQQTTSVLWLGPSAANDPRSPLMFLRRAYSETPRVAIKVTAQPANAPLTPEQFQKTELTFVAGNMSAPDAAALHSAIAAGRTAVVLMPRAAGGALLGALAGTSAIPVEEVNPTNYAMLGEIDFRHALFAPFADPRFSDFTKIHVWRYRRFDASALPGAHVLARFDSGDPAVVEVPVGKGRIVIFATGWQPEESQLAVSSKFVPLMWSLLETAGFTVAGPQQLAVGDPVRIPRGATVLRRPDGSSVPLAAGASQFADTNMPGVYAFSGAEPATRFVVNLDPNESRTAPLPLDELQRLGVPAKAEQAAPNEAAGLAAIRAAETENRQKLWRWLIGAALVVVLIESTLAGWANRRASPLQQEAAP